MAAAVEPPSLMRWRYDDSSRLSVLEQAVLNVIFVRSSDPLPHRLRFTFPFHLKQFGFQLIVFLLQCKNHLLQAAVTLLLLLLC